MASKDTNPPEPPAPKREFIWKGCKIPEKKEDRVQLRAELQQQHKKFAEEIILRLKYFYRLHEEKPFPKTFSLVNLNICDAIFALSYLFRFHYRQAFYELHDELIIAEKYEKFVFSLPVARGRRYTFNFLFRISFIFEISMYLFKKGYDYFDITRKCLAEYPDLLYFYKAGGWSRVNQVADFIIAISKVLEVDITVEHPLLGAFIETDPCILADDVDLSHLLNHNLKLDDLIENGVFPNLEGEFFNPKDMQSLKFLYTHFVAPKSSRAKCCHVCNLKSIEETFPLYKRAPFAVSDELDIESYITYDFYDEKREVYLYFRSFLDPETVDKDFPIKTSPDSPDEEEDEENLPPVREFYVTDSDSEDLYSPEDSFAHDPGEPMGVNSPTKIMVSPFASNAENASHIPEYFTPGFLQQNAMLAAASSCFSQSSFASEPYDLKRKHIEEDLAFPLAFGIWDPSNPIINATVPDTMLKEISNILPRPMSIEIATDQIFVVPRSISNVSQLPRSVKHMLVKLIIDIQRLPREKKDMVIQVLPLMRAFLCVDLDFLTKLMKAVPYSEDHEAADLINGLKNVWYVSLDTKYILFKIITHCRDLTTEERDELFCILVNIPDNMMDMKAKFIEAIEKIEDISDKIKIDLIKCILDFTESECMDIHRSAGKVNFLSNFEGKFANEEQLREEFEKCVELYRKSKPLDIEYDLDKLPTCSKLEMKDSDKMFEENPTGRQLTPSTRAILKTLREEDVLKSEAECISRKTEVPQSSSNRHYYKKSTRKSRRRSKK